MMKFVLAAGAALALVPAAGHAAPSRVEVRYADLDLTSAEGQQQLERRIAAASRRICRRAEDRSARDQMVYVKCRDTAMQAAGERAKLAIAKSLAARDHLAAR